MMAKRRSYATLVSYLTPPFMETGTRGQFRSLQERIQAYYKDESPQTSLAVKKIAVEMGLHRELRLDSVAEWSADDIARVENFAEEIATEKMTGRLYTAGVPYEPENIRSTVFAMSADPIAYSLAALDRLRGKATEQQIGNKVWFTRNYLERAKGVVSQILDGRNVDDGYICTLAGITERDLAEAKEILTPPRSRAMAAMMAAMATPSGGGHPAGVPQSGGGHPSWIPKAGSRPASAQVRENKPAAQQPARETPAYSKEQKEQAHAIAEIERTVRNVANYKTALQNSPEQELQSVLNALSGGYTAPSSGGDAVANPQAVPTGRNLYAVNAEATPSETAWDKGVELADATIDAYKKEHGEYPRKVSYTFWSSEFIETEGATIAQALYMLGVEPVRDAFGRVSDLRLIPSEALGRPRVDVVVQTSGQFRDLAASRLALISRAVEMAAVAADPDNFVHESTVETERLLVEQGVSPQAAREMSTARVFGGVNGMYGTGIQEITTAGDRWENEKEIADTYVNNMGAAYGSDKNWGEFQAGLLRAVLHNTDVVVQPRQSNTWGALSLDHVYEFMGGMNLAVREVTGKDPDAYFADYRNRNRVRMQELKEAIGVESRATLFNPEYLKEVMKGGASSAAQITEFATNTYGWNVMKPDVIDNEMWDRFYEVYVKDEYGLGTESFFRRENPQALQEITAVMLETARKEMWQATDAQLTALAALHADLVREFGASGAGMSGSNAKLQEYIAAKVEPRAATQYRRQLQKMQTATADNNTQGMVLKKEEIAGGQDGEESRLNGMAVVATVLAVFLVVLAVLRKKRKRG
jgi:cobaltochelatase CobN